MRVEGGDQSPGPADRLLGVLRGLGATRIVGLPDNTTAPLFDPGRQARAGLPGLIVSREGEAFAIASGLWLGGERPVVVIQNTGLLESGDALRGTALRMGVPLVCLIGFRGVVSLELVEPEELGPPPRRRLLVDARIDSAAVLTETTLRAWGVPAGRAGSDGAAAIEMAWGRARRDETPVAVLLDRGLTC